MRVVDFGSEIVSGQHFLEEREKKKCEKMALDCSREIGEEEGKELPATPSYCGVLKREVDGGEDEIWGILNFLSYFVVYASNI